MSSVGLLSAWPIHLHFFLHICCVIGSWLVRCQSSLLLIFSGHLIFSSERKQLLMNVCSLLEMPFVTRQVSQPYRSTDLTEVGVENPDIVPHAECRRSPHWFQANQRLSCFSDSDFDVLVRPACS
ncbi:unnamed protein product [Heterobilharzia americana]|nr:unnamed protein product [Heterobilharzia americana]